MIAAIAFKMDEERFEASHVQILEPQPGRRPPEPRLGEAQQEAEGVAIGRHRVGTRALVRDESLGEEPLEQRRETRGAHRGPPGRRVVPRRVVASAKSSGIASMYQYVSPMSTCPR